MWHFAALLSRHAWTHTEGKDRSLQADTAYSKSSQNFWIVWNDAEL